MDLPTYTSIWRIEKRLYKLYDFRLPMPVPVGQIAVFAAITVPYVILLTILGLPFNHTLFWLYVLPPAVITWLATRPVLESKRLPELIISQVRYLGEPGTWCRMAPLAEKDDVVVVGKVWRRDEEVQRSPAEAPALAPAAAPAPARRPVRVRPAAARKAAAAAAAQASAAEVASAAQSTSAGQATSVGQATSAGRPARTGSRPGYRAPLRHRGYAAQRKNGAARRSGRLVFVARRGSSPQWPGRRGRPWRPRRHQPRSPTMSGRPRSSRWLVRPPRLGRWAGPVRWAGPAPWAGLVQWADVPPDLLLRPPCSDSTLGAEESVTQQPRPEGAARPSGPTWPVKDPHAPAAAPATANRAPAEPPWATPVPPAPAPPVFGNAGGPAGSAVPPVPAKPEVLEVPTVSATPDPVLAAEDPVATAADPVAAATDPVPAGTDPVPAAADPILGMAASLAGPDTAAPAGPDTAAPAGPDTPRRPHLPPGPRSVGQRRGTRSHRPACQQGRLRGLRRGPGRMWRGGWLRLPRRRLLRLRPPCLRHASPGRPDSSSAWTRPG